MINDEPTLGAIEGVLCSKVWDGHYFSKIKQFIVSSVEMQTPRMSAIVMSTQSQALSSYQGISGCGQSAMT